MCDAHSHDSASGPSADGPEDVLSAEVLREALECETEGAHVERLLADGRCPQGSADEGLPAHVLAGALAALDEAEAEHAFEDVLADALALESVRGDAPLPNAVRTAALAAWDDQSRPTPVLTFASRPAGLRARRDESLRARRDESLRARRDEPLRARRMRAPLLMRPFAAAALLVVVLGAGLWLAGRGHDAEAGLQLRALSRRDLGSLVGMSQVEPGYFATLGRVFAPGADELLSFGLAYDGVVVVGAGDAIRVARPGMRVPDARAPQEAILRLESGEARLATRDAPIPLAVDGVGLLILAEGAAHVALHAESPGGAPAVALMEHSVARFHRADGTSVPLVGPTRVLLTADGVKSLGAPARSLFRELAFFGGPLPRATQVRTVSPRLFELRAGTARRGRQEVRLEARDDATPAGATLAWRPPPVLADARILRVALRAPAGTTVAVTQVEREPLRAEVRHPDGGSEPGVATVEIPLAADWYERLPDGRLELTLVVPAAAAAADEARATPGGSGRSKVVRAWFDGVALVLGRSADARPAAPSSAGGDGVPDAKDQR